MFKRKMATNMTLLEIDVSDELDVGLGILKLAPNEFFGERMLSAV